MRDQATACDSQMVFIKALVEYTQTLQMSVELLQIGIPYFFVVLVLCSISLLLRRANYVQTFVVPPKF